MTTSLKQRESNRALRARRFESAYVHTRDLLSKRQQPKCQVLTLTPVCWVRADFCHSVRLARSPAHRGAPLCFRSRGASADDVVVLHRPESGGGSGRDADLRVDVLDVVVGRLGGDDEPVGDLAGREATRGELEHVDLPA